MKCNFLKKIDIIIFKKLIKLIIRSFFILIFIILSIVLIFIGGLFINSKFMVDRMQKPLFGIYVIVSESMKPTINVDDAVVIVRASDDSVQIGNIITFMSDDIYYKGLTVTHRVVEKNKLDDGNYIYKTKGDNNILEDSALVSINDVYGKVIFKLPKVGKIKRIVSSRFGFLLSIILPIVIVIFYETYRIKKIMTKQNKKLKKI